MININYFIIKGFEYKSLIYLNILLNINNDIKINK